MIETESISGRLLFRNVALNFLGHGWLLVLGLVSAPILLHWLGPDSYGILALATIVAGYFGVLELGISRAAVKFMAERLARRDRSNAGRAMATAVTSQFVLGALGAVLIWLAIPMLSGVLQIPPALLPQAQFVFATMGIGLPLVLASSVVEGALSALQRFDLLTPVRITTGTLKVALAVLLVTAGFGLRGAALAIVIIQGAHFLAMAALALRLMPFETSWLWDTAELRQLLRFGGWATVSSLIGPVLVYLDRFLVGALVSISAVSYYAVPFEAVTKLWIIPYAAGPALYAAYAVLQADPSPRKMAKLYLNSVKLTFLTMAPITVLVVAYAPQILEMWLGSAFAERSSQPMRILAFGVLINSLAQIPFGLMQAIGRPDIPAKFHLAEASVYVPLCFAVIPRWGITGAAAAWTARVIIDGALLAVSAARALELPIAAIGRRALGRSAGLTALLALGVGTAQAGERDFATELILILGVMALYSALAWRIAVRPGTAPAATRPRSQQAPIQLPDHHDS